MPTSASSLIHQVFVAGALALGAIVPAQAAPNVVATLEQPPGGLSCSEAADQTEVALDFKSPRGDIRRTNISVNGEELDEDTIAQDWPHLTLRHWLRPGRNTVEVYDRSGSRTLTILIGTAARKNDKGDVATVDCERDGKVIAEADEGDDEVVEYVRPAPRYYYPAPYAYSYYDYGPYYYGYYAPYYGGYYRGGYHGSYGGGHFHGGGSARRGTYWNSRGHH